MIEYRGVHKSFGDQEVLRGVDLTVKDGETFYVLGRTGAGKTVTIRLLVGLMRADGGRVLIDGEDITELKERDFGRVRLKCGMVFQLPTLFDSYNVFENVAFGLRRQKGLKESEIEVRVREELVKVELDPAIADRMPHELSFGEQKRVGLARTTVLRPRYVLYDEPTTGLDPFTAGRIDALIKRINRDMGVTAIVVSHDLSSMRRVAGRVGLLIGGMFHFIGTVEEFMSTGDRAVAEFRRAAGEASPDAPGEGGAA